MARAGFLRRAGRQRKRGLTEQKCVVTAQALRDAHAAGKRLPVLSLDAEIHFATSKARAKFAQALDFSTWAESP